MSPVASLVRDACRGSLGVLFQQHRHFRLFCSRQRTYRAMHTSPSHLLCADPRSRGEDSRCRPVQTRTRGRHKGRHTATSMSCSVVYVVSLDNDETRVVHQPHRALMLNDISFFKAGTFSPEICCAIADDGKNTPGVSHPLEPGLKLDFKDPVQLRRPPTHSRPSKYRESASVSSVRRVYIAFRVRRYFSHFFDFRIFATRRTRVFHNFRKRL